MADDLYDVDFVAWTEAQAAALRARRSGANALDYDNLAEEIEDLGKSEQHACESQVRNIIERFLKIEFVRSPETLAHWRGEVFNFRVQLDDHLTPVLVKRVRARLDRLYGAARKSLIIRELGDETLPKANPYGWEQIRDPDWYPQPRDS